MVEHEGEWVVPEALNGRPLDGVLRSILGVSWSIARRLVTSGKVRVHGELARDPERKVRAGAKVAVSPRAPRPEVSERRKLEGDLIVHLDASVVVVAKPAGISTVAFDDEEEGTTLDALVREVLKRKDGLRGRAPLGVVQRLDKATSGVLVFTRTFAAKKHLGQQLRLHTVHRRYLAIAHGDVKKATIETFLVDDRGDGLRGSADANRREGQRAITHVEPIRRLEGATLVACRLETGRQHQIRIHLAERGHPLVGETVYVRDFAGVRIPAPRLMLHAAELGFVHPQHERPMRFAVEPPADFQETLARLEKR